MYYTPSLYRHAMQHKLFINALSLSLQHTRH